MKYIIGEMANSSTKLLILALEQPNPTPVERYSAERTR
jgi:hypothetical protein